ncbi:MAG: hypothetical protein J2P45_01710 [Candidatus Dormibacteraeota bacterium]|nr:hypothetical protein [Candidatus Dormibacteraeota bacterium]
MSPKGFPVAAALPDSDTERLPREPLDLDDLRRQLDEAEDDLAAAKRRVWRLRVQIQDEELRLRWAQRERESTAWSPPQVVLDAQQEALAAKESSNGKRASNGRTERATTSGRTVSRPRRRPKAPDVPSKPAAWSGPPPQQQIPSIAAPSRQRRRKKQQ